MLDCWEVMALGLIWSFPQNCSRIMQSLTWYEAACYVIRTTCVVLQSFRHMVGRRIPSYGFRVVTKLTAFGFSLVEIVFLVVIWIVKLQRRKVLAGLWSECVDFILNLLQFSRQGASLLNPMLYFQFEVFILCSILDLFVKKR